MLLALLLATATPASVAVQGGDIVLTRPAAGPRTVATGGGWRQPVVSPDGRQIAAIRAEPVAQDRPSLWLIPTDGRPPRRLLAARANDIPERNLSALSNPHWSPDGRHLYVDAPAWATSSAVHRVDAATGAARFIVAGGIRSVIHTGRWRGHLLVSQHKYYRRGGSYEPVVLVRPDGRALFEIPGSAADDGVRSIPRWLRADGATAR